MGAAVRASQIGGALQAILAITTDYAQERTAFERKISKFQAVQHNLARLAGEVAAAVCAASSAADALQRAGTGLKKGDIVITGSMIAPQMLDSATTAVLEMDHLGSILLNVE